MKTNMKMKAAKATFDVSVDGGITSFDTAEVYGFRVRKASYSSFYKICCGQNKFIIIYSCRLLLVLFIKVRKQKDPGVEVDVATKFAALPWRLGHQNDIAALKDSLNRLELSSVELCQLHWPGIWGNEGYLDGLGDAVEQGLVKAVGVSNYREKRLCEAHAKLQKRGIPLASNQVNYSLIYRALEENGVKSTCDELGITLIAYSPIAQAPISAELDQGNRRKVILNWLIAQDNVVPIPGAKNAKQATEFAGVLGWRLNSEVAELHALATEIKHVTGFPVEKL
ncbi:hypothetical protein DVH24_002429 [Malus domestica]|uniref:NADP-dependent oxidoreductase domain-containing protein n=1 Tax=Malus domestica TaxID=3750 RepID=A0A498IKR8_MALDO|nr:hypothetical protein DVH24_002429 [Malus domestica]